MRETFMFRFALALTFVLCGCASPANQAVTDYIRDIQPRAESGIVYWSNYYQGLYEKVSESNYQNRGAFLQRINSMISRAKSFERGEIDRNQFEHYRREAHAGLEAENDVMAAQQRQATSAALLQWSLAQQQIQQQQLAQPIYTPVQPVQMRSTTHTNCSRFGNQVNCTSY